jgi:hypothetical protein
MLTVGEITHEMFHEAALHMGIFNHNNEGQLTMEEAVSCYQTPNQIRFLFARLILEGYPTLPLWDQFHDDIAQDDISTFQSNEIGINRTLQRLSDVLHENDRSLKEFGLPEAHVVTPEILGEQLAYRPRRQLLRDNCDKNRQLLRHEQECVYSSLLKTVIQHHSDSLSPCAPSFIEGKPGRGKTFLIDTLSSDLRSRGLIMLIVSTTALTATLYEGGQTAHNLFRIPVTDVSST